jgi:hypothetical protein
MPARSHGLSRSRAYVRWQNMKQCCFNPKDGSFHLYGGRGIGICPEWSRFEVFHKDLGDCPPGKGLVREDLDGAFAPSNCKWGEPVKHVFRVGNTISRRHGLSKTRAWKSWAAMNDRCLDPTNRMYRRYGGRGILICGRWRSFEAFLEDMGPCPHGKTLERLEVNGNYEASNCVWADWKQQANNRSTSRRLTIDGVTMTMTQWAEKYNLSPDCVQQRLKRGIDPKIAVSAPSNRGAVLIGMQQRAA